MVLGDVKRRSWVVTCLNVARVMAFHSSDARGFPSLTEMKRFRWSWAVNYERGISGFVCLPPLKAFAWLGRDAAATRPWTLGSRRPLGPGTRIDCILQTHHVCLGIGYTDKFSENKWRFATTATCAAAASLSLVTMMNISVLLISSK